MKLYVTDNHVDDLSLDTVVMPIEEFNTINSHPYIESCKFDAVVIDMVPNIKTEYLASLLNTTIVIPRIVSDIDSRTISLLATIYRDKAAELRYTFMKEPSKIAGIVDSIRETYIWDFYY